MWHDPIVEEVHAVLQALLKQFNGDVRAISQHGAQLAAQHGNDMAEISRAAGATAAKWGFVEKVLPVSLQAA